MWWLLNYEVEILGWIGCDAMCKIGIHEMDIGGRSENNRLHRKRGNEKSKIKNRSMSRAVQYVEKIRKEENVKMQCC